MTIEIKVPTLPESVSDAVIAKWYKKVGDTIARDENLVDLETDKVMLEVPAPKAGVIENIIATEGTVVKAGELLAVIREGSGSGSVSSTDVTKLPAANTNGAKSQSSVNTIVSTPTPTNLSHSERRAVAEGKTLSSPAPTFSAREEKRVAMSRLRLKVAERLKDIQNTAAILTTFNEINMKNVMDLRNKYKDEFEKTTSSRLGFMSFFTKAAVEALKQFPVVNASIDGSDILYHNYYDIGIAIGSERGLVVPVIRNADQVSMASIEKQIRDYAKKAGDGKIAMEDLMGGTFTITNAGTYGSMMSTPIINPPQSAILGMHNIVERAVVENNQITVRPMMYVALSYDHRIIDGREAVLFPMSIKKLIEDPARFLLQM